MKTLPKCAVLILAFVPAVQQALATPCFTMDDWIAGSKDITTIECVLAPASGDFTIPTGILVLTALTKL
jgi:hypothetical protein